MNTEQNVMEKAAESIPLFREYPALGERLPRVPLGTLPTPVEKLDATGRELGLERLYIKRDDLSGDVYGGNKVRKLEFLLGDALRSGKKEVLTMGFAGSNHATATAIYAGKLGLKCISMLMPQMNAHYLRRNLLAGCSANAELCLCSQLTIGARIGWKMLCGLARHGVFPKYIPGGGSSPLGIVGYVNAAFELKDQIDAGLMPPPDFIYVPMGSMGTAAGLTIGLRAAGLDARVVAVRVIEKIHANESKLLSLIKTTACYLRRNDASFPGFDFKRDDFNVRDEFIGEGYAHFTEDGAAAARLMRETAGIPVNGSYSAKAFAALVADARKRRSPDRQNKYSANQETAAPDFTLADKTVLFWNTFNSRDLTSLIEKVDYRSLPHGFHQYFETDVQLWDIDVDKPVS